DREIFEARSYFRHGVHLPAEGAVVLDVGANIGLFTLQASQLSRGARVYAFEPVPAVAQVLRANVRLHGIDARVHECALAQEAGDAGFTFYPHLTLVSGRYADLQAEKAVVRAFLGREGEGAGEAGLVEEMLDERLRGREVRVQLRRLGDVIREEGIERIDLLKVDVQRAEEEVLRGVEPEDWARIRQVVVEVHDEDGRLARVVALLEARGFRVAVEQEAELAQTRQFDVYAVRPETAEAGTPVVGTPEGEEQGGGWASALRLEEAVRAFAREQLPDAMVPAAWVLLDRLPLTPNGKLDRAALPSPEGTVHARRGFEPPASEMESALAETWCDVLGVERVGRWDDFFELGGHSLRAVQVVSRIRQVLGIRTALGEVFEQPVLADFALALEQGARAQLPPIEPADRGGRLPLSFAQQRLWFLEQMGGMGSTYHVPRGLRLRGRLDRAALRRTLDRLVARHEALRTTFVVVDGEPEQRIAPAEESAFRLAEHDLGDDPAREQALRGVIADEVRAPFDLERGPLIRGRLVRLADDDHVLLITMHHVVSDGWSMGVLVRELGVLYGAFRAGAGDPLPPLPVQYADYAAWQRRWVAGEVVEAQAAYWARTLAGAPEVLALPADRPRPARRDHAGAVARVVLDEELTAALKALSKRHRTTLFMTLMAGWAVVLARLSGQDDVVVGTPTANRGRREIEGLIGFFLNTLAHRVDLSGAPTVAELLARVKARALEGQQNQDIPFEQVVERVQPARSMAHTPLFQVMFAWQNAPRDRLELPGLELSPLQGAAWETAKFDLSLTLAEADGRIAGGLIYATALFDPATIERHVAYLRGVLAQMAADDRRPVEALPLLPEAERRQVVEEWNATDAAYPAGDCIHHLFEAQAARTPDAPALADETRTVTYAELNARANRLAHHLAARGVGPDVCVGVCLQRTPEMVEGVLAVLKAGGAYVALDPEYPEERLRYMLADSAPAVLLAHASAAERFAGMGVPVIAIDRDAAEWADAPRTDPARRGLTPEHLVYVIYTSGSTGQPKGVMNQHRTLVNRLAWGRRSWGIDADEAVLCKTSLNFDGSVREIFLPLMAGARVVLARPGGHRDPSYLLEMIGRERITTVNLVPSLLQVLLEAPEVESLRGLKRILCGGEALPGALLERFRERLPEVELHNLYGPSEAATAVTSPRCVAESGQASVPIGG
ncbi:MAG TPA: FkbM family methyltransferase, partial [Longimicrobium sp.]|nr:FkbM family methyltransferase [Longimicrobium sp.]